MSAENSLKSFLSKSTVSQLRQQCSQRGIPVTPGKKDDLIKNLVDYLEKHPDDEFNEVAGITVSETVVIKEEKIEEEEIEEEKIEEAEEEKEEDNEEAETNEGEQEEETDMQAEDVDHEKDEEDAEEEQAAESIEKSEEMETESAEEDVKKGKAADIKTEGQDKPKAASKKFVIPTPATYQTLFEHLGRFNRRRTLLVHPIEIDDMADEELKNLLKSDTVERAALKLSNNSIGFLELHFKTVEAAIEAEKSFPMFKEGVSVERRPKGMPIHDILHKQDSEEKKPKHGFSSERFLCAHFVPEGTSEEVLKSQFPEAKSFVWARDEKDEYKGMLFIEYESIDVAEKEWTRILKNKVFIGETQLWFNNMQVKPNTKKGTSIDPSAILTNDAREKLLKRKRELTSEIAKMKDFATIDTINLIKSKLGKVEETLSKDAQARKTNPKRKGNKKDGNKPKPANKPADNKKAAKRPMKPKQSNRNTAMPRQGNQPRQSPRRFREQPVQGPGMWSNQPNYGSGMMGPSNMNQYPSSGYNNSSNYSSPSADPQATVNAVSLLVGLSNLLGRRQQAQGNYPNQYQDDWHGEYNDGPSPKRSRFSGGMGWRR